MEISVVVTRLEQDIRERAAYGALIEYGAQFMERASENDRLAGLVAAARAAEGDISGARDGLPADESWDLIAQALIARRESDMDAGARLIGEALMLDGSNAYTHNVAGSIATAQDRVNEAIPYFRHAALAAEGAVYSASLGAVFAASGQNELAVRALDTALPIKPARCDALTLRAQFALSRQDPHSAIADVRRCLEPTGRASPARGQSIRPASERKAPGACGAGG